ncbi:MAG: hypothetical protein HRT66_00130 [Flavobacteriaceae bacterium]|nr:hypothetical protein [Flavobacteriaceae bacterium]
MIKTISTLILLLTTILSFGQRVEPQKQEAKYRLVIMSSVKQNGDIQLRWGVNKSRAWRKLNQYGYQITRHTILRDSKILDNPDIKNIGTFLAKPMAEWEQIVNTNDYAAVIAQSLYGESFEVEGQGGLETIVNMSQEQEDRFNWALYAADQDYDAAVFAGLGYTDTDIKKNEKYLYKIVSMVPKHILDIEATATYIGFVDYQGLPKPLDLFGHYDDNKVTISWNYHTLKDYYSGYFVERSEDGISFSRLNQLPMPKISKKENKRPQYYIDSIVNNKKYYYRINGYNLFGNTGPYSDTIQGIAKGKLAYRPRIVHKELIDNTELLLKWDFPKEGNKYISGFELKQSSKINGYYKTIVAGIDAKKREVSYKNIKDTYYYTITAKGKTTHDKISTPILLQPNDTIPPKAPAELVGDIDSLGIVTLKWKANTEKDLLGYRVYRGDRKQDEFYRLTGEAITANVFYDSISVKTLTSKIYYRVTAEDKRYNASEYSITLELKKPDYIKPNSPVFAGFKVKGNTVEINWVNSTSDDVEKHELYRNIKNSDDWQVIFTSSELETNYTDKNLEPGSHYYYNIVATDYSLNESEIVKPLHIKTTKSVIKPKIKGFSYDEVASTISWGKYDIEGIIELELYLSLNDQPAKLIRKIGVGNDTIGDIKVVTGTKYEYMLRAIYNDGSMTKMSVLTLHTP